MAKAKFNEKLLLEEGIKERFDQLDSDRTAVLDEARTCSELTLPYLLPPDGHKETDVLDNPYQNLGARLVNNLANKIAFTMLPPNQPFFRLFPDEATEALLDSEQSEEKKTLVNQIAVKIETRAQKLIAKQFLSVPVIEAFKSLVVTGNALLVKVEPRDPLDKGLKSYRLDNYVVNRDYRGNPIEIITREAVSPHTLDEDVLDVLDLDLSKDAEDVTLYTRAVLRQKKWYEYQAINDTVLEDTLTSYDAESFPYMPLRWTAVNGHDYGVGHCSQHKSDLITLEASYQLLLEHASVAGRTVFGIKPGSQIDLYEFNNAENGKAIMADFENDLTVARVEKYNDLKAVYDVYQDTSRRLEQAFLSANSVTREAERVTAMEIRYLANDLEQSHGGVYSVLSQEFQVPMSRLILKELERTSEVDLEGFEFVPVTGMEALGRNNDADKLRQFSQVLQETPVLQQAIAQYFNVPNYIEDLTVAYSLPSGRYIKTAEQIAQEQQAMQEQQLAMQSLGSMAENAGAGIGAQLGGGGQQNG